MNAPQTIAPEELLRKYKLRLTETRKMILECFLEKDFALSQGYMENALPDKIDRVTIYRSLKTFLDKGLIHKILDDEGGIKYALCSDSCTMKNHNHSHVHFKCEVCGKTICIESIEIPEINLPKEFLVQDINMLVSGICENCRQEN